MTFSDAMDANLRGLHQKRGKETEMRLMSKSVQSSSKALFSRHYYLTVTQLQESLRYPGLSHVSYIAAHMLHSGHCKATFNRAYNAPAPSFSEYGPGPCRKLPLRLALEGRQQARGLLGTPARSAQSLARLGLARRLARLGPARQTLRAHDLPHMHMYARISGDSIQPGRLLKKRHANPATCALRTSSKSTKPTHVMQSCVSDHAKADTAHLGQGHARQSAAPRQVQSWPPGGRLLQAADPPQPLHAKSHTYVRQQLPKLVCITLLQDRQLCARAAGHRTQKEAYLLRLMLRWLQLRPCPWDAACAASQSCRAPAPRARVSAAPALARLSRLQAAEHDQDGAFGAQL